MIPCVPADLPIFALTGFLAILAWVWLVRQLMAVWKNSGNSGPGGAPVRLPAQADLKRGLPVSLYRGQEVLRV